MILVAKAGIENGDLRQLTIPKDYLGNFCGLENQGNSNTFRNQSEKPVLYYLDPFSATESGAIYVCVASCPNITALATLQTAICDYGQTTTLESLPFQVSQGKCPSYIYSSKPVLGRCVPSEPIPTSVLTQTTISIGNSSISIQSLLENGKDDTAKAIADLSVTWPLLVICSVTAIVLSFIWLFAAQYIVGPFVWVCIVAVNLLFIAGTIGSYVYWNSRKVAYETNRAASGSVSFGNYTQTIPFLATNANVSATEVRNSMIVFIIVACLAGILVLITLAMIKRIKIAIQIINEVSNAFLRMPMIVCLVGLLVFGVYVILALVTPKGPATLTLFGYFGENFKSNPSTTTYMLYVHIFGIIWTYFTLIGILHCTIAGAVAEWYWSPKKNERLNSPVSRSLGRICRFHLGSIMLGSILITIVEVIRIVLFYIQKKVSKSKVEALKYLVAIAQCCMTCVEMIMKFVNKNAYIYIAITGQSFFQAASAATSLLVRNAAKTAAVTFVSDVALLFAKVIVVGLNCLIAYLALTQMPDKFPYLNFPSLTVIFVGIESYLIANVFFSNYDLAIDTIFLSVLEDLDKNDGTPERPYMMSKDLRSILSKKNKTASAKAENI